MNISKQSHPYNRKPTFLEVLFHSDLTTELLAIELRLSSTEWPDPLHSTFHRIASITSSNLHVIRKFVWHSPSGMLDESQHGHCEVSRSVEGGHANIDVDHQLLVRGTN